MPIKDVRVKKYIGIIDFLKEAPAHFEAFKKLYELPEDTTIHDLNELDVFNRIESDTCTIEEILNYLYPNKQFLVTYDEDEDVIIVYEISIEIKPALPPVNKELCQKDYERFLNSIDEDSIEANTHVLPICDGIKRIRVHSEMLFVYLVSLLPTVTGYYKVVAPDIKKPEVGAIYYIVEGINHQNEKVIYFFRGTYGYSGAGPHQSAFIETMLETLLHLTPNTYSADHLLTLLRL